MSPVHVALPEGSRALAIVRYKGEIEVYVALTLEWSSLKVNTFTMEHQEGASGLDSLRQLFHLDKLVVCFKVKMTKPHISTQSSELIVHWTVWRYEV
jgi:hypothetical protein